MSPVKKYLLATFVALILSACGGGQKLPKELKKAIADISSVGDVQTTIEKETMSRAIAVFRKYAQQGNATAMYWVSEGRLLDKSDRNYITLEASLKWLNKAAEMGHISACLELADIYSGDEKLKNPEKSYFWFYIGYFRKDGMVHALNENKNADPVPGDFRNESVVSDLVKELGFEKVKKIEKDAQQWLVKHPKKLRESADELKK